MTEDHEIEDKYRTMMKGLARGIDTILNGEDKGAKRTVGWFIAMFPFGDDPGRFNYMSNATRDDIIVLLKEMTKRFEGHPESPPGHA